MISNVRHGPVLFGQDVSDRERECVGSVGCGTGWIAAPDDVAAAGVGEHVRRFDDALLSPATTVKWNAAGIITNRLLVNHAT